MWGILNGNFVFCFLCSILLVLILSNSLCFYLTSCMLQYLVFSMMCGTIKKGPLVFWHLNLSSRLLMILVMDSFSIGFSLSKLSLRSACTKFHSSILFLCRSIKFVNLGYFLLRINFEQIENGNLKLFALFWQHDFPPAESSH